MDPSSSKTTVNNVRTNDVQNALELHSTSQMILAEGRTFRPQSTEKNYKSYQDEYLVRKEKVLSIMQVLILIAYCLLFISALVFQFKAFF
jgi:hypothetical protein